MEPQRGMPVTHSSVKEKDAEGLAPSKMEEQTATEFNVWPHWITTSERSDLINFTAAPVKRSVY